MIRHLCGTLLALTLIAGANAGKFGPWDAERVVFLGDSITHAGHYISMIEARLLKQQGTQAPEFINMGLPSETCSGQSEPDHPFPRPNVHERLDRVLAKTKPDLIVACYGMNDGIYYPFSEERFSAYKDGINRLIKRAKQANAKLILMTPPPFDPLPFKMKGKLLPKTAKKFAWFEIYENYDAEVMSRYSAWVLKQQDRLLQAIDLRTPVLHAVAEQRKTDSKFKLSDDGVHIDQRGHAILASAICDALKIDQSQPIDNNLFQLLEAKRKVMHLAWLTHAGHKRPGPNSKLTLEQAKQKTASLQKQIADHVTND